MSETPRSIIVGAIVRLARYEAGYSVTETARLAGVDPDTVRRLESGLGDPRRATVLRVLAACSKEPVAI
jgi:transcriptional regulator with XRE-family HTH domain